MPYTKIGFDAGLMSLRGTHVAIFDYALQNQKILGNESIIFYDRRSEGLGHSVFQKFNQEFKLVPYDTFQDVRTLSERELIDAMYLIKSGEQDEYLLPGVPNLIHAVFPQRVNEKHGDVYAFVSKWLSEECSNGKIPYVPHMVHLPIQEDSLKEYLHLSDDQTIFGCYGGCDSFNLEFVKKVIARVVSEHTRIYFLMMNITHFIDHPQVIFLPGSSDPKFKSKFINTCDAMIHARGIGESFGLACGEFSIHNKPIITYALSPQRNHIDVLGKMAILYNGPKDLQNIFLNFDKDAAKKQNWDCYSLEFSPSAVMEKFSSVFLSRNSSILVENKISPVDRVMIQGRRFRKKVRSLSRRLYL